LVTRHQDVSRLQIEKKEAESAGKSFYEQFKTATATSAAAKTKAMSESDESTAAAAVVAEEVAVLRAQVLEARMGSEERGEQLEQVRREATQVSQRERQKRRHGVVACFMFHLL
jgi:hypothetical protein